MNAEPAFLFDKRMRQTERALAGMGGTHTLEDIMQAIEAGRMQSFVRGSSWVVTQLLQTPQRRVCEVFLAVGDLDDVLALAEPVEAFARAHEATLLRAFGRPGWGPFSERHGWHPRCVLFAKEL